MKKIIIIPAYNEEESIVKVYKNILNYNKEKKENFDVIVINDGSTDNTENLLKTNEIPHITLINNLGIGGAVQTGYKYAYYNGYDIAIQFDGDGQHDTSYLNKLIEPLINEKSDMVIGSRFINQKSSEFKSSALRRVGINMISFFIKLITRKKIYDTTSGFRAVNKKIIMMFSKNYPVEYPEPVSTVQILKSGYRVSEIPVNMNERNGGISSIRAWKSIYYMFNVILSILVVGLEEKNDK